MKIKDLWTNWNTGMFGHVDQLESYAGGAEGGADDAIWRPDEGVDGTVSRRTSVDIEQTDAFHGADGVRYSIDYLALTEHMQMRWVNWKIDSDWLLWKSKNQSPMGSSTNEASQNNNNNKPYWTSINND